MRKNIEGITNAFDTETMVVQRKFSEISEAVTNAIANKSTVYDNEQNRTLAITDEGAIVINDEILEVLTRTIINQFNRYKEGVQKNGFSASKTANILSNFEILNAAIIENKRIQKVSRELNKMLAHARKTGDEDLQSVLKVGFSVFFTLSKRNIYHGRRNFKNLNYTVDNEKQMKFARCEYICNLLKDKVFDYQFLVDEHVIEDFELMALDLLARKDGAFSYAELADAFIRSGTFSSREEILEHYLKEDKSFFLNFASAPELMNYAIAGKITPKEAAGKISVEDVAAFEYDLLEQTLSIDTFPKNTKFVEFIEQKNGRLDRYVSKELLRKLSRENFMKLVFSTKIKHKIAFTSEDYINLYGKLTSDDILLLSKKGRVNEEDFIKLIAFNSIQFTDENEYAKMIENQMSFYNINRLENLMHSDKLNGKFMELFNKFLTEHLTDNQRQEYFLNFINQLKEKENSEELLTQLIIKGIDIPENLDYQISKETLLEMYLEEKISERDIFKLYKKNLIQIEVFKELYSDEELKSLYQKGKLPIDAINLLDKRVEFIRSELKSKRITLPEILSLYSVENGINIEEFEEVIDGYKIDEENIAQYLSDNIPADKVDALFTHYYISHDDLSILVSRGIISKEQAEEYAQKVSSHNMYESLFDSKNGFVVLTNETEFSGETRSGGYRGNGETDRRAVQVKNDPDLQKELLDKIGFDKRVLKLVGYNNSLDGYKVFSSEDYKVMVFINEENVGNATYIMSLEQGMYFLNNMERNKNKDMVLGEETLKSTVTKRSLRETEHVKVKNASRGWGANIVDSIRKLSPKFSERLRKHDEYTAQIDSVVEMIKEDYDMRRE